MVRLVGTLSRICPGKILVAGDFLLDTYTIGKVKRISPEAPVAVVHVTHEEHRPGGAGNVVLNLLALGMQVTAIGRVGADSSGVLLRQVLQSDGVGVHLVLEQSGHPTPVKNRIIADNQQLVRVDREETHALSPELEDHLLTNLAVALEDVKVIAISDYGKGLCTPRLLAGLIAEGKNRGIPVIIDPKGVDFHKYKGATIIKPNLSEAYAASGLASDAPLAQVAERVLDISQAEILMITRAQEGISLFFAGGHREDFPVQAREIKDVTGAGDTVLAMLTCALASGLSVAEAAQMSNIAAGIAIARFGCAQISIADLAHRLLERDVGNKVFDEEHLFALQHALAGQQMVVIGLHAIEGLSAQTYAHLRRFAAREGWAVIVYLRDPEPHPEFVELLVSLREVDFIVLQSDSLTHLCNSMEPDEVFIIEEGALRTLSHSIELVSL